METWKDIKGYEGYYQASTLGRIRSLDRKTVSAIKNNTQVTKKGKMIKLNLKRNGYLVFDASKQNIKKTKTVHRIIAETFIFNDNKPAVNHINANKTDNRVENLEWVTMKENTNHASSLNLMGNHTNKKIKCVGNNMIFDSSTKAAVWLNETKYNYTKNIKCMGRNIRACCVGKRKSAFGYKWEDLI